MSNIQKIDIDLNEFSIEPSRAAQIKATFEPMVAMLEEFEQVYNEITEAASSGITPELSKRAKRLRIDIGRVRIDAEKARKAMKEEYLRAGQAIDGANNILKWAVSSREDKLREIEEHAERMEAERIASLQRERVSLLSPYVNDAESRDLGTMEAEVWDAYLSARKKAWEDEQEAIRIAEQERIDRERAEAEERARVRVENERLQKEAAKREAEMKRLQKEADAKLEAERAERQRVEAELAAKREAEMRAEREREEAAAREREEAERLAKAPIKKRLHAWVGLFELPEAPQHEKADAIKQKFAAFKEWAAREIESI